MTKFDEKKVYLAYISYPFSSDPIGNTKKVCEIGKVIMSKYPNIFVIIPHTAVDMSMFGIIKKHYTLKDNILAPQLEFTILNKIDMYIQGVDDDKMTAGCVWEMAYCMWLNRTRHRQIIMLKVSDIL